MASHGFIPSSTWPWPGEAAIARSWPGFGQSKAGHLIQDAIAMLNYSELGGLEAWRLGDLDGF